MNLENALHQFAKEICTEENGREETVGHKPAEIWRPTKFLLARGGGYVYRNIICQAQTFFFGTKCTRTVVVSRCFNATSSFKWKTD